MAPVGDKQHRSNGSSLYWKLFLIQNDLVHEIAAYILKNLQIRILKHHLSHGQYRRIWSKIHTVLYSLNTLSQSIPESRRCPPHQELFQNSQLIYKQKQHLTFRKKKKPLVIKCSLFLGGEGLIIFFLCKPYRLPNHNSHGQKMHMTRIFLDW